MWNRTELIVHAFAALPLFASTDGVIDLMYNISLYIGGGGGGGLFKIWFQNIQKVHMTDADEICSFTERNDNSAPFKRSKHITLDMRMS